MSHARFEPRITGALCISHKSQVSKSRGVGPVPPHWVLFELLINIIATVLLLMHMQVVGHVADAAAALLVVFVAVALSVYKPQGLTRYGWRKQQESRAQQQSAVRGPSGGSVGPLIPRHGERAGMTAVFNPGGLAQTFRPSTP